jgi:hypothetical protein
MDATSMLNIRCVFKQSSQYSISSKEAEDASRRGQAEEANEEEEGRQGEPRRSGR